MHIQRFRSNGFVYYDVCARYLLLFEPRTTEKTVIHATYKK